ncbi:MAG: Rieske 2Fe-2S domain-containing protein [Dyella sp.]
MDPITAAPLCQLQDIPDGGAIACDDVLIDGEAESIIVYRRGDTVRAYLNICPHAGRRLDWSPGKFLLKNEVLVCAAHGASFDVDDGLCSAGPCRGQSLRAVAVWVDHGQVVLAG